MLETDRCAINENHIDFGVRNTDGLDRIFYRWGSPNRVADVLLAFAGWQKII